MPEVGPTTSCALCGGEAELDVFVTHGVPIYFRRCKTCGSEYVSAKEMVLTRTARKDYKVNESLK